MVEEAAVSAVVVPFALPARLERIRRLKTAEASDGVPAHITILFPFLPAADLTLGVRSVIASVARTVEPFACRFERVARFPGVLYLAPEPTEPFVTLTERLWERFPQPPPYGGRFEDVIPHLGMAESVDEAVLDALERQVATSLPFERRVDRLLVLSHDSHGWRRPWRISLGSTRVHRSVQEKPGGR